MLDRPAYGGDSMSPKKLWQWGRLHIIQLHRGRRVVATGNENVNASGCFSKSASVFHCNPRREQSYISRTFAAYLLSRGDERFVVYTEEASNQLKLLEVVKYDQRRKHDAG